MLRFFGVVTEADDAPTVVGIMTEFVRNGSLAQHLRSAAEAGAYLPLRARCELALHAANGHAYLHELQVGRGAICCLIGRLHTCTGFVLQPRHVISPLADG